MPDKKQWLPHLIDSIPDSAKGYTISSYSIALEGWRRGLTLKFINENRTKSEMVYELSSDKNSHVFVVSRGDLITSEAMRICRNKDETKKYLQNAKVPTPNGKKFSNEIPDLELIKYANKKGFPLVLKPVNGTGGKGVIAGIKGESELKDALRYVRNGLGYQKVILEEYFEGEDYRVYVVENEVVAVTKRIPANIIGDGKSTIEELISQKNQLRKESPILRSSLIKIDEELNQMLRQKEYQLCSVPSNGEVVYLKSKNNISAGGDPIDITDEVSDEVKKIAIDGVKAIPGLPHAGVDLMVNVKSNTATVIEINTQASIRTHLFPMDGTARDVPKKIIDYYFPETKGYNTQNSFYFDITPIWDTFRKGIVKEYVLPKIPNGFIESTRFIVSGDVQRVNYGRWVRRQARDLDLQGYVRHLKNNQTSIVVSGEKSNIEKFRTIITTQSSKRATVLKVSEKDRNSPVKIGFEIINPELDNPIKDGYYPIRLKGIYQLGRYSKNKPRSRKNNKNDVYKRKLEQVQSSTSWKITKPIRLLGRIIKNKKV